MKKSFLVLLCVLLAMMFVFVACGEDDKTNEPAAEHTHTYAKTWTSDATGHWYAATCEHKDAKANFAAHVDDDNNGICDTCEYVTCEHTYAETWSTDEKNHWYAATCKHAVTKDLGAHADADKDGACDTCAYVVCEHTYATEYTTNETNHWYAATCGCNVKKDDAAHAGMEDGICDTCNYGAHDHTWSDWKTDGEKHWKESTCESHAAIKAEEGTHTNELSNDGICDVCAYVTCAHTYEDGWSFNATQHFHKATCGCNVPGSDAADHDENGEEYSCSVCGYTDHEHTFAEGWTSDGTNHWHVASCGCEDISGLEAHIGMNDGICDVCNYGYHEHTWADSYSNDADNHWYNSTCEGHDILVQGTEAHVDINNDGTCDVCFYVSCNHTFGTEWTYDAKGHWYAATCGHNVKGSYEEHDFSGENFSCVVCACENVLDDAINKGTSTESANKVASGTVSSKEAYDNFEVTFEFGENYTHIVDIGEESGNEYWIHKLNNDSIFGLQEYQYMGYGYGVSKYEDATASDVLGRKFDISFLSYSLEYAYGVEDFLYQVYNFAMTSEEANGDLNSTYDEATNTYYFSFECISGDGEYGTLKVIEVSFTLSENNVITSMALTYDAYWDPTANPEDVTGKDYIIYEDGSAVLLEGAEADRSYSYTITQTEGDRVAVSPYNLDEMLVTDFEITDVEGNPVTSDTEFGKGEEATFAVSGLAPEGANLELDAFTFSATCDGEEQWFSPYFDTYSNTFSFTPYTTGEWEVIIKTTNVEKIITFTVVNPTTTSLTPTVDGSQTTSATVYAGMNLTFSAIAQSAYADKNFTATVEGATLTESETLDATWVFNATEIGTYVITLTSTANPEVTTTLTVEVLEAPDVSDVLVGFYQGGYQDYNTWDEYTVSVEFVPESEGALKGTMNITVEWFNRYSWDQVEYSKSAVYSYEYADGAITTAYVSGDTLPTEYTFAISSSFGISFSFADPWGEIETVEMEASEPAGDTVVLEGYWIDAEQKYSFQFWPGDTNNVTELYTGNYSQSSFYCTVDENNQITVEVVYDGGIEGFDNDVYGIVGDGQITFYFSNGTTVVLTPEVW
ncbi:MAG: hypothetical protein E7667_05150 [Ruminococcaceae bacterium]|nr:hypothetical protein [Oscillospiraceae bacterium]